MERRGTGAKTREGVTLQLMEEEEKEEVLDGRWSSVLDGCGVFLVYMRGLDALYGLS